MRRRRVITLLGGAAAWSLAARAQQPPAPVIGYLNYGSAGRGAADVSAFRQGLKESGYVEGQSVTVDYRWAEDRSDRLPVLAAQLAGRPVSVITAAGTPAAFAAKAATSVIPIVFETAGDPVRLGLVASLNRPGGNVTGVTQLSSELVAKRLGLLHDLLPAAKIIGLLVFGHDPLAETQTREMEEAAIALRLKIHVSNAGSEDEIERAFAGLAQLRADALLIGASTFFFNRRHQLTATAARHRVPTIYQYREYVSAGGLMSYGASRTESYRLAGVYTGRVLKGEKPADLPVARATKFTLAINLKTAKALGLTIAPSLLALADEVIE